VQRDAGDDERDARDLGGLGDLGEHHDPDDRGGGRQQRDHERVRRAREAGQRELVGDVGDHGRAQPDAHAGEQRDRVAERGHRGPPGHRRDDHGGDEHRRPESVDAGQRLAVLGDAVGEHDVEGEQGGVRAGQRERERLVADVHAGEQRHAGRRERERDGVARRARAERRERDDGEELDGRDGAQREAVDGEVEAAVHRCEDGAPGQQ